MKISNHRSACVFKEGHQLTVWVCPDSAGLVKSGQWDAEKMENNSLYLTAPATRENWYELHAYVRRLFSPVTVECG
ncbi:MULTISPECIES: hypothetical protein [Pseudoalteromonas]|uniref:Uncharacterized protein n=1 Tax=Pseudoalteromonas piscicida TaxID=43662 RepID=A0A2A5JJ91_PSEO7|nr:MULTISPECIES: hypothetical protein [Pseudoalteromonas]NSY36513.1 hypothetical protein [Pseudoalteromonas sp. JC28]PCK29522.1 hypothetical protein CEX98_22605 [Pseudoalteromonas piscicida]